MIEKTKRVVVDRWPSFNDIAGGARFINGVSEPIAPHEAQRIASALSGRVVDAHEYSPNDWEGLVPGVDDEAVASREDTPPIAPESSATGPEGGDVGDAAFRTPPAPGRTTDAHAGRRRSRGVPREGR
jgi:hypothetical protein